MAKGARFSFLKQDLLHHLNEFMVLKDLFDDMGMWFAVKFAIRKAAFSTHLFFSSALL
jgi:hypothetical protein